jgi:hypothetical protein
MDDDGIFYYYAYLIPIRGEISAATAGNTMAALSLFPFRCWGDNTNFKILCKRMVY